jgi:tetratricopeptide (TPR) repeat protein
VEVHDIAPGAGRYFGGEFQYRTDKLDLSPRFGLSHVYDDWKPSAGLGLTYKTSDFDFQFDFAHGFHEDLADDQRFSLTIRFGGRRDAGYYHDGEQAQTGLSPQVNLLHVLANYPDDLSLVRIARDTLAHTLDTLNRLRYLEMFIDLSLADNWYLQARQKLEEGDRGLAGWYSDKAIDAYNDVRKDTALSFPDKALLNNAESHAIAAITETDDGNARRHWQRVGELAATVVGGTAGAPGDTLIAADNGLRAAYLRGLSAKALGRLPEAIEHFKAAQSTPGEDPRSIRPLSRYELSKCLMESGQEESGLEILRSFFENPNSGADMLAHHYPRFPAYPDRRLSDDALYLAADHYRRTGREREALRSYGDLCRFYPDLDKCRDSDVEERINELVNRLSE